VLLLVFCAQACPLFCVVFCYVLMLQVMEHTPHIFLSGPEAEQLAVQQGMQLVDNATFTTQQRKEQWERYAAEQRLAPADEIVQRIGPAGAAAAPAEGSKPAAAAADNSRDHCQTVGAVAIDSQGRLAAGKWH
jgi:beta-aspartyl-peptidase (threonine type)